uniref:Uncharacterized protein n=1 Tax=Tanacetum cinerariifolium TaxID=118510 RepID=A0A6L2LD45_TANCI|nr:hypothetical protein [Tanacetum cinerariifolium]
MIEPEVPIKKKDKMRIYKVYARKLKAKEQKAARLSRAQQDVEVNNSWDNIQAMMDADRLLAERLQARERTLKTMFKHHVEDNIWKYQQGLAKSDVRLQVDHDVQMAYNLLRFIRKQLMEGYTP